MYDSAAITSSGELYTWAVESMCGWDMGTMCRSSDLNRWVMYLMYDSAAITSSGELYTWGCGGLVAVCHSFCIYFSLYNTVETFIQSYILHSLTFAEAHLHIFIAVGSVGGTSLGCRAEIRTRACLTASQRATN
jgi:hypothetical protein